MFNSVLFTKWQSVRNGEDDKDNCSPMGFFTLLNTKWHNHLYISLLHATGHWSSPILIPSSESILSLTQPKAKETKRSGSNLFSSPFQTRSRSMSRLTPLSLNTLSKHVSTSGRVYRYSRLVLLSIALHEIMLFRVEDAIARISGWMAGPGWTGRVYLEILGEDSISSSREERSVTFQDWLRADVRRAADLKNCILYSITRLSVRAAVSYNSKRIHAST